MIKFYATAAIAALALASCNKEIELAVTPVEDSIKVAVVADMPMTRTALGEAGVGTIAVNWVNGVDKVGFFNHTADVNIESSAAAVDGSGRATFTATVPSEGTYYAYYPYQNETGSNAPTTDGVVSRIPNVQVLIPNTFDPKADLMVSTGFSASGSTSTDPTTIQFKRLGAFLKFTFVNGTTKDLSAETVTSISIERVGDVEGAEPEKNLAAKYRVSSSGATYQNSGYKSITATVDETPFTLVSDAEIRQID